MSPTEQTPATVLLEVIRTLQAELQAQREEAARAREESKREVARLVAMVEGLTGQLDQLLRDRDEERRAELARLREEARAAAARAAEGSSDDGTPSGATRPEPPPSSESRAQVSRPWIRETDESPLSRAHISSHAAVGVCLWISRPAVSSSRRRQPA